MIVRPTSTLASMRPLLAIACLAASWELGERSLIAIISTGDEIVAPGKPIRPGAVYDSNAAILAAAVEEARGSAKPLGIGPDDEIVLSRLVDEGLATCDMVVLSGGTSKGAGDLCYRAVASFNDPGIVRRSGERPLQREAGTCRVVHFN